MIGLYHLTTHQQMPGFVGVGTMTKIEGIAFGLSSASGYYVFRYVDYNDTCGAKDLGLAYSEQYKLTSAK